MRLDRIIALGVLVGMAAASAAYAQSYPTRPVRIVTTAPGAANDRFARMIAQGLTDVFGKQVIVDNRGGGILAIDTVAKATPDGYTVLLYSNGLWTLPLIQKVSYDMGDFAPVTLVGRQPNVLVVHPGLGVASVKDLIALAKAKPGQLNYGSGSTGSTPHIAGELFKNQAGVDIVRVAYKGAGPALTALLGGEVQLMFPTAGSAAPHVKSGKLKALAVTSAQPSELAPGLPTVAAAGLPGYESIAPFGIFAPAGTPAAIVRRLSDEIGKVVNRADVKRRFFDNGVEVVGGAPEELAATIRSDTVRLTKLVKEAGLRAK